MKSPMERKDPPLDSRQYAQESGRQERTVSETKARLNLRKQLWWFVSKAFGSWVLCSIFSLVMCSVLSRFISVQSAKCLCSSHLTTGQSVVSTSYKISTKALNSSKSAQLLNLHHLPLSSQGILLTRTKPSDQVIICPFAFPQFSIHMGLLV